MTDSPQSPENRKQQNETIVQLAEEELQQIVTEALAEFRKQKSDDQEFLSFLEALADHPNPKCLRVFCLRAKEMISTEEICSKLGIKTNSISSYYIAINELLNDFGLWPLEQGQRQTESTYYMISHELQSTKENAPTIILNTKEYNIIQILLNNGTIQSISTIIGNSTTNINDNIRSIKNKIERSGNNADGLPEIIKLIFEGRIKFVQEEPSETVRTGSEADLNSQERQSITKTPEEMFAELTWQEIKINTETPTGFLDNGKNVNYQLSTTKEQNNQTKLTLTILNNYPNTAVRICIKIGISQSSIVTVIANSKKNIHITLVQSRNIPTKIKYKLQLTRPQSNS